MAVAIWITSYVLVTRKVSNAWDPLKNARISIELWNFVKRMESTNEIG